MTGLLTELRTAMRQLLRSPAYLLSTVPVLALGVGATTAVFSMAEGSLFRELPYFDAHRVVKVQDQHRALGGRGNSSVANYLDLRERTRTLERLAAYSHRSVNLAGEEAPVRAQGLAVTADFLPALGVSPSAGRDFLPQEATAGSEPVAILTHETWLRRFGGSPDFPGASLLLHGIPTTVIGILPPGFWFPGDPEFIVPFAWTEEDRVNRGNRQLELVGRLANGVQVQAAQAELQALFTALAEEHPAQNQDWTIQAQAFSEWAFQSSRSSFRLLMGAVLLTLLVACVNVTALTLVRAERRRKELAVRAALGADRMGLLRFFAAEGLLVGGMSAILGILVAAGALRILMATYGGALPRAHGIGLNPVLLGVGSLLAVLAALGAGAAPALRLPHDGLESRLRASGGGTTRPGGRLLQGLVVGEVAVAMVVVVGAGLLTHSFWKVNQVEMGFDRANAITFQVDAPVAAYPEEEQRAALFRRAQEAMEALPGVQAVGLSDRVPGRGGFNVTAVPSPDDPELQASFVEIRSVSPGFFPATGVPLLEGRLLREEDAREEGRTIVVSDVLASALFPDGEVLGKRLLREWDGDGFEIVGVVGSVREFGPVRDTRPALYWAYPGPTSGSSMVFVVRSAGNPTALLPSLRGALGEVDGTLPIYSVQTLEDASLAGVQNRKLAAELFSLFGGISLILAALGIFSVLAFGVEQRTREMGVRIALGATRSRIIRLVMGRGMGLVAAGVGLGLLASLALGRWLQELLFEVPTTDPLTLGAMAVLALALGALASWVPVWRASAANPILVLRAE